MARKNDVAFSLAYGASVTFTLILKTNATPSVPVDVTGYSARLQVLKYDGTEYGSEVTSVASPSGISVGTTDGTFAATLSVALTAVIEAAYGSPPPREHPRFRFFVTPPAGNETEAAHGNIVLLGSGEAVTPVTATVTEGSFVVQVTALATTGPTGPAGPTIPVTSSQDGIVKRIDRNAGIPVAKIDGTAAASSYARPFLSLASCGAYADATISGSGTNDYTALMSVFTEAAATGACEIRLDEGKNYLVTQKLDWRKKTGITLRGGGSGNDTTSFVVCNVPQRAVDGTSATSIDSTVGVKVVTATAGMNIHVGDWLSFQSRGSTARVEGPCTAYSGTSLSVSVVSVHHCTGTGFPRTDWNITNETENYAIALHSSLFCSLRNLSIININSAFRGTLVTFEHDGATPSDTTFTKIERVSFFGYHSDGSDLHTCIRLNNNICAEVTQCNFNRNYKAIVGGNGPLAIRSSAFSNSQGFAPVEAFGYLLQLDSCAFEGVGEGPSALRATAAWACGASGPIVVESHNCIYNDAGASSTGPGWLILDAVKAATLDANYFQNDSATVPAIYMENGTSAVSGRGNLFQTSYVAEFGTGSTMGTEGGFDFRKNNYVGSTPFKGTNYIGKVEFDDATNGGPQFGYAEVEYLTTQRGIQKGTAHLATAGTVNDISVSNAITYLDDPTADATFHGASVNGEGQEAEVRWLWNHYAIFPHNSASATGTRFSTTTAGTVVFGPAPSGGYHAAGMIRDAELGRVRLMPKTPTIVPGVQTGTATLTAGASSAITAVVTSSSVIRAWLKTPGGTVTSTVEYLCKAADRTTGIPGSFKITAVQSDRTTTAALDTSTVEWSVTS